VTLTAPAVTFAADTNSGALTVTARESDPADRGNSITVNANVTVSSAGDVVFRAGDFIIVDGNVGSATGYQTTLQSAYGDNDAVGGMTISGAAGGDTLTLDVGGLATPSGVTEVNGGTVGSFNLVLLGSGLGGSFSLGNSNPVGTVAARTNAPIVLRAGPITSGTVTVGTVNGINGIDTNGHDLSLTVVDAQRLQLGDGSSTPQPITAVGCDGQPVHPDVHRLGEQRNRERQLTGDRRQPRRSRGRRRRPPSRQRRRHRRGGSHFE